MNIFKKIIFLILILNIIHTQISIGGTPKSVLTNLNNEITNIVLPTVDREALLLQDNHIVVWLFKKSFRHFKKIK